MRQESHRSGVLGVELSGDACVASGGPLEGVLAEDGEDGIPGVYRLIPARGAVAEVLWATIRRRNSSSGGPPVVCLLYIFLCEEQEQKPA